MVSQNRPGLASLGFLRLGLFALVILDIVLHAGPRLAGLVTSNGQEPSAWVSIPILVTPVMAPILVFLLLIDYVMSRVRAADDPGEQHSYYVFVGRLELLAIGLMLIYWIPFFLSLGR